MATANRTPDAFSVIKIGFGTSSVAKVGKKAFKRIDSGLTAFSIQGWAFMPNQAKPILKIPPVYGGRACDQKQGENNVSWPLAKIMLA
ncbi:hypothetical protein RLDS_07630 [Sphingobium lactosutens DS20]|uniref:Uncharacterized protein n=1 Tax=Sphingobium lactosutens DS20 TaxID=1331060 RepID=T0HU75_9SPHN|nr:hypothetical protein RLDS_07630 [Sphingobium lactosutens DS20]